jgi:hypothetical protein
VEAFRRERLMHFEIPKVPLHGFKDFAKHYLMIVFSILTALGLEAWIEHVHHAHAAATASAQIEAELSTNLANIQRVRDSDAKRLTVLKQLDDYLVKAVRIGADAATIKQRVDAQTGGDFYLGLAFPTLRHEAWDVAVANQSAGWIDTSLLRRYDTIYAYQSNFERSVSFNTSINLEGSKVNDIDADLQAGVVQPREILHTAFDMTSSMGDTVIALDALAGAYRRELPQLAPASAAMTAH